MFTILVAEDDTSLNKMICAKLAKEQFRTVSAFDGEEALEIMDREHIDLIVSDIMMPKTDGYEITKLLRAQLENQKHITIGGTELDYAGLTVTVNGVTQEMPPKEFYLLFKLLNNPNKIFTRLELLDEIWDMGSDTDERNVDAHIKKLRKKFDGITDFEIVTVRGLGYKAVYSVSAFLRTCSFGYSLALSWGADA